MNEDSLEFLFPIIGYFSHCSPQEKANVVKAIRVINDYFKKFEAYQIFLGQKSIEGPTEASSSNLTTCNFKDSMNFLYQSLRALKVIFPTQELTIMNRAIYLFSDRFHQDFEEICVLGSGSYGLVVKAKHMLDQQLYAIKKIPFKSLSSKDYSDVLKEVEILSKLTHPNIAFYYSSWVQLYPFYSECQLDGEESEDEELSDLRSSSQDCSYLHKENSNNIIATLQTSSNASCRPKVQPNLKMSNTNGNPANLWLAPLATNLITHTTHKSGSPPLVPTLFIQIQLGRKNLEEWLIERNERFIAGTFHWNSKEVLIHFDIFESLLFALDYIHSKGIVHRDVKPANVIFKRSKGIILTDFGLAKLMKSRPLNRPPYSAPSSASQTTEIGTPTYAAPETRNFKYNSKVDIYSLGIILLELLHPFGSHSERAFVITNLKRKRQLDPKFCKMWKSLADLILAMTEEDPKCRPTASKILIQILELKKHLPQYSSDGLQRNGPWNLYSNSVQRSYSERNIPPRRPLVRLFSMPLPQNKRKSFSNLSKNGTFRSVARSYLSHIRKSERNRKCSSKYKVENKELKKKIIQLEEKIKSLTIRSRNDPNI